MSDNENPVRRAFTDKMLFLFPNKIDVWSENLGRNQSAEEGFFWGGVSSCNTAIPVNVPEIFSCEIL